MRGIMDEIMKRMLLCLLVAFSSAALFAQSADQVGAGPGPGVRYATDAYPGFDPDKDALAPERKEKRWFAFINGPKEETSAAQFRYAQSLDVALDGAKAVKAYDALVREWPTAPEAARAQTRLAAILFEQEADLDDAFAEYRYLVDFYSAQCDYRAAVDRMYEIAGRMREEGKTILFFHFRNSTEVRRAYECCVLRAPGATWASAAMLTIGDLRVEEGDLDEAVQVYENLQNLYYGTREAKSALVREATVRMTILEKRDYNRARVLDTIRFLERAKRTAEGEDLKTVEASLADLLSRLDDEDFKAAAFYDSRTRTRRSAIRAYEQFLKEHPQSAHAPEAERRLVELKGE